MRRLTLSAILALGLVVVLAGVALAWIEEADGYYCTHTVGNHICLYEDAGATGDNLVTSSTIHDLGSISHTLPGQCNAPIHFQDDWNDCITSVKVWLASGWKWCLYRNAQGNGTIQSIIGPKSGSIVTVLENDSLSSVYLITSGSAC